MCPGRAHGSTEDIRDGAADPVPRRCRPDVPELTVADDTSGTRRSSWLVRCGGGLPGLPCCPWPRCERRDQRAGPGRFRPVPQRPVAAVGPGIAGRDRSWSGSPISARSIPVARIDRPVSGRWVTRRGLRRPFRSTSSGCTERLKRGPGGYATLLAVPLLLTSISPQRWPQLRVRLLPALLLGPAVWILVDLSAAKLRNAVGVFAFGDGLSLPYEADKGHVVTPLGHAQNGVASAALLFAAGVLFCLMLHSRRPGPGGTGVSRRECPGDARSRRVSAVGTGVPHARRQWTRSRYIGRRYGQVSHFGPHDESPHYCYASSGHCGGHRRRKPRAGADSGRQMVRRICGSATESEVQQRFPRLGAHGSNGVGGRRGTFGGFVYCGISNLFVRIGGA